MVRRSHKRRKRFACGHLGYGQWCHRCKIPRRQSTVKPQQPAMLLSHSATAISRRSTPQQVDQRCWQTQFLDDPIPLRHLPISVVLKTRLILATLEQGMAPATFCGKRFQFDRTLLRIPVTYRYRLLCRWQNGQITPLMVLSHEAYNAIARHKKRVSGL